jgi:hypothetical protein
MDSSSSDDSVYTLDPNDSDNEEISAADELKEETTPLLEETKEETLPLLVEEETKEEIPGETIQQEETNIPIRIIESPKDDKRAKNTKNEKSLDNLLKGLEKKKKNTQDEEGKSKEEYIEEIQAYNEHSRFSERLKSFEIKYSKLLKMNINQLIDLHNKIERRCSGGLNQNLSNAVLFVATTLENVSRASTNFNLEGMSEQMRNRPLIADNLAKIDVKYGRNFNFSPHYQVPLDLFLLATETITKNRMKNKHLNINPQLQVMSGANQQQQNRVEPTPFRINNPPMPNVIHPSDPEVIRPSNNSTSPSPPIITPSNIFPSAAPPPMNAVNLNQVQANINPNNSNATNGIIYPT